MASPPMLDASAGKTRPFRILYHGCQSVKPIIVEMLLSTTATFGAHGFIVEDCTGFRSNGSTYKTLQFRACETLPGQKPETRYFEHPDLAVVFHAGDDKFSAALATWQESAMMRDLRIPVLDIIDTSVDPAHDSISVLPAAFDVEDGTQSVVVVDLKTFLSTGEEKLSTNIDRLMRPYVYKELYDIWASRNQQAAYECPWWHMDSEGDSPPPLMHDDLYEEEDEHHIGLEDAEGHMEDALPPYEASWLPEPGYYCQTDDLEKGGARGESRCPPTAFVILRARNVMHNCRCDVGRRTRAFFVFYSVFMLIYSMYMLSVHLPALFNA